MQLLRRSWLLILAVAAVLLIAAIACEEEEEEAVETPTAETPAAEETPTPQVTPGPGVTDTEIKLGHTNDLAGTRTAFGPLTPAMNAYFQKVNEEDGGVCGRDITLIREDDQYAPDLALEKTRKLVEQDEVLAIVGAMGTDAHLGAVYYLNDPNGDGDTSDGIPDLFVSTGYSGWGDYETWPWTTGYIPSYIRDGTVLAQYINENFPGQKVGIFYQDDAFGKDYLNTIKENLADPTLVVSEQSYQVGAPDVSAQVINIQDAGAQVVVMASVPPITPSAIVAANAQGYNPQWVVSYVNAHTVLASLIGGGTEPEQLRQGFELIQGTISTNYLLDALADADDPAMVEHARIMDVYDGPSLGTLSVYGQSLAELTVDALSRTCDNLTREGLMDAVESTQGFRSSVGLPGIEVNLGPTDHDSIQEFQVARYEADGTLAPVGDIVSVE